MSQKRSFASLIREFFLIFSSFFGIIIGLGLSFLGLTGNEFSILVIGVILIMFGIASALVLSNEYS